jgi:hypothetical protein
MLRRWLLACACCATLAVEGWGQEQFVGDPLPYTTGPYVKNQFMQLDVLSPQNLHTGIDIWTYTFPNADQHVVAPIRFGSDCQVIGIGPDWVRLQAADRQSGDLVVFEGWHITPDPGLSLYSMIPRNWPIGTVESAWQHLHAGIFLRAGGSSCCDDEDLVHPQRNAFSLVGGWNDDSYAPTVDATNVHSATVGNPTVFEINAYDRADMEPRNFNGIYAINLYVDDMLVDGLQFDRWRAKSGTGTPNKSEYYYCTTSACTPSTFYNDPNVLRYKLSWNTQAGDHIWRIDVLDPKGNVLHGDPRNGLPGREVPSVSMGGTIEDGQVRLTWRIDPADVREAGIESFSLWQAANRLGDYERASGEPILAADGQDSYSFTGDVPVGADSVWFRLTAANTVGSTLMLGETSLGVPAFIDGLSGYPNPMPDRCTIALSLAREGTGEVAIFDLSGRRVRTVHRGALKRGMTRLVWDGGDDEGRALPNGVYLLKVFREPGPGFTARKITLFR